MRSFSMSVHLVTLKCRLVLFRLISSALSDAQFQIACASCNYHRASMGHNQTNYSCKFLHQAAGTNIASGCWDQYFIRLLGPILHQAAGTNIGCWDQHRLLGPILHQAAGTNIASGCWDQYCMHMVPGPP